MRQHRLPVTTSSPPASQRNYLLARRSAADALRLAEPARGTDPLDAAIAADLMQAVRPEFVIHRGAQSGSAAVEAIRAAGVPIYAITDYGTLRFVTDGWVYQLEAERIPTPTPAP